MKFSFKKSILFALITALVMASLPFASAFAASQNNPIPQGQISNERLEKIWARQLHKYDRFGHVEEFIARVQRLLDRAETNGKDASSVQAALASFSGQWKQAKPVYESMKGIVNSHQGFDSDGKVTDPEKAKRTILAMHDKFQEIKSIMNGAGKELRKTIKAYRAANPHLQPTATPLPE